MIDVNNCIPKEQKCDPFLKLDYEFSDKDEALRRITEAGFGHAKPKRDLNVRLALWATLNAPYLGPDDLLSFPCNSNKYSDLLRYNGPQFRYRAMMREMKYGVEKGLLEVIKAPPNSHKLPDSKQSVVRATPKLRNLIDGLELRFILHDPIRLNMHIDMVNYRNYLKKIPGRKYKRALKRYSDTPQTKLWRKEIREINQFLKTIRLEWPNLDRSRSGHYVKFNSNNLLITPIYITRVFARGRFDCYGRCHGFWQNQKKWLRSHIKLNGFDTCEPDYSAIHANIAYLEKGFIPPDEPYEIDGFDRKLVKRTFAILLNAGNLKGAVSAVSTTFDISEKEAEDVINAVKERHAPIIDQFHADAGIRLMRIDSDICVAVMLKLVKESIPFLPIHDGFRVPVPHEDRVKEIMIETFQDRYPGFICKVKQ